MTCPTACALPDKRKTCQNASNCFKLLQTIPRGGSQQQSASARDAAQARPVDSTASARMCNSGAHFRVPICRFGDSSHSFGTSSCNSASVEQTSLRDQPSAPAPNAVCKIPSIVMQACGPTKRRGDVRSARPLARRGRRPLAGRSRPQSSPTGPRSTCAECSSTLTIPKNRSMS